MTNDAHLSKICFPILADALVGFGIRLSGLTITRKRECFDYPSAHKRWRGGKPRYASLYSGLFSRHARDKGPNQKGVTSL